VWRVAADCSVSKMWCGRVAIGRVAVLVHYGEVAPLWGGVKCMENYWCGAVLVCCGCDVGGLWYGGVAVWGCCGVGVLRCGDVAVWGCFSVGKFWCGGVALCWNYGVGKLRCV
jgi:hypothetical protein